MSREINLVPDIKGEMIKTLKLRNLIFFLCIVVSAASAGVAAITGTIMLGQQAAVDGNKDAISSLSTKLNSYSDLNDFLTIKDQLGNIHTLTSDKRVLSRTFNILSALIPTGPDTITISELIVNLEEESILNLSFLRVASCDDIIHTLSIERKHTCIRLNLCYERNEIVLCKLKSTTVDCYLNFL